VHVKLREIVQQILIDPRKLTEYALNFDNPIGADKAAMFQRHLGFTKENHQLLLEQIKAKAMDAEATLGICDEHGQRYQVDLEVSGIEPEQKEAVRTGWIVKAGEDTARLVTLYVRSRQ
jgi:hypothetical protein